MGKAIIITDLSFSTNIGTVTITGGETPSVIEITGLTIINKPSSIENNAQLSVSYIPSNTTQKGVSWRSSNENVATVSGAGYVTVKSAGTVTITATSIYNSALTDSFTAICSISSVYVPVTSVVVSGGTSGKVGDVIQLSASVLPSNATNKSTTWRSSDENIAIVSSTGLVTLKMVGLATIIATSASQASISGSKSITVTSISAISESILKLSGSGKLNSDSNALTWSDESGKGNDFILSGFDMTASDGWTGNGLRFKDGSKGMAKSINTFVQGAYFKNQSITIFIKLRVDKNARNVFFDSSGKIDGGDFKNNYMVQAAYGKIQIISNENSNVDSPTFSSGDIGSTTLKCAIRQTSAGCKTWINNISKESTYTITNLRSESYHLILGQIGGLNGYGLCGEIFKFELFDKELTDSEVEKKINSL